MRSPAVSTQEPNVVIATDRVLASHSPSPSIIREHVVFSDTSLYCFVLSESWSSWLPTILAYSYHPKGISSDNTRHRSFFPGVFHSIWRPLRKLLISNLPPHTPLFVSGSIDFVIKYCTQPMSNPVYVLIEGNQPYRRRLDRIIHMSWERIKHYDCGEAMSGQFWFGYPSGQKTFPRGLFSCRVLINVIAPAAKAFQTDCQPPHVLAKPSRVEYVQRNASSLGLLPIDHPHVQIICPSVFTPHK